MAKRGYKCWYCGHNPMEDKGDFSQCPECEATRSTIPHVGADPLKVTSTLTGGTPRGREPTSGSPSGIEKRRATLQRKRAKEAATHEAGS